MTLIKVVSDQNSKRKNFIGQSLIDFDSSFPVIINFYHYLAIIFVASVMRQTAFMRARESGEE